MSLLIIKESMNNKNLPVLLDSNRLPRYWSTVWSTLYANDLAVSTHTRKLKYIDSFYGFIFNSKKTDCLDDLLALCDVDIIFEILEGYFISLRNNKNYSSSLTKQWKTVYDFIHVVLMNIMRIKDTKFLFSKLDRKIIYLDNLYSQFQLNKKRTPCFNRSLPFTVVDYLLEVLDPESNRNPFKRERVKWTVYLIFRLLLTQGLRKSELLLQPVNAIKSDYDFNHDKNRYWINITNDVSFRKFDDRYSKPEIKTPQSNRQIPISETILVIIENYINNYRGKPNHPFLLNSAENKPLSTESISSYFVKISKNLPLEIRKILKEKIGKETISPHDLRHTCAVIRLNQFLKNGDSMELALQKMRSFFGWSRTSEMPTKYAKAIFEERIIEDWAVITDTNIEILKSLPNGI